MRNTYYKYALLFLLHLVSVAKLRSQELPDTILMYPHDPVVITDTSFSIETDSLVQIKKGFKQIGRASYYAHKFEGRRTASGERFSQHKLTAAHRKLKFGTLVKVTNLKTGKWIVVRINDRGPFTRKFIIDLSRSAAQKLDLIRTNARVKLEIVKLPPSKK